MKDVGCALDQSAIHKIEKGSPRRRITVDELVALSRVFDKSLDQLVADPKILEEEAALAYADEWCRLLAQHLLASQEHERERQELEQRLSGQVTSPELYDQVRTYISGLTKGQPTVAFLVQPKELHSGQEQ